MTQCLEALWPRPEDRHQLFVRNRETGKGRNIPVKDVNDAAEQAHQLSAAGNDVYVAIASYWDPLSRTAANATGAYVFHMDIDCGEAKAEASKGYLTPEIAQQALTDFRAKTGLPKPTLVLQSGGGIQVFWTLDNFIEASAWKRSAWRLKELSHKLGLKADPSRTGDIASVMRIAGTLNWKYDPPRPVVLQSAPTEAIKTAIMIEAICKAYDQYCPAAPGAAPGAAPSGDRIRQIAGIPCQRAILERLHLALTVLDPDVAEPIWKLHRIAPLARLARDCPELAEAIYEMARAWSRGDYWVHPSRAWITPGHSNGKTGEQVFDEVWQRFLNSSYAGNATTLGTIFHDAKEAGWVDEDDTFTRQEMSDTVNTVSTALTRVPPFQPLDPRSFPHLRAGQNGMVSLQNTIENTAHLLKGYGITVSFDVIKKDLDFHIPGHSGMQNGVQNFPGSWGKER